MALNNKTCPNCGGIFQKRNKGGTCPNCGAVLMLVRDGSTGAKNIIRYELKNPKPAPISEKLPHEKEDTMVGITARKSESTREVTFNTFVQRIVCPACKKLQLNMIHVEDGTAFERKCKCGCLTTYRFAIKNPRRTNFRVVNLDG